MQRVVFNDSINKIPGVYNEKGIVAVQSLTKVQPYDYLNLTAAGRVLSLDQHFEVIQNVFKQQLGVDQFDEFGLPVLDNQRLIGRIVNMSQEDPKLSESNIGLLNLNEENSGNVQKIKLQLSEVQSYSLFDGEIVAVEGCYDANTSRLNVAKIHKIDVQ